jgi:hypothetical protein
VQVQLETESHSEPIAGRIRDEQSAEIGFVGLVQLVTLLERVRRDEPITPAPTPGTSSPEAVTESV